MSRFLQTALDLAKPTTTVEEVKIMAKYFQTYYNMGVIDASNKAHQWGNESCGGAGGESGRGYHNLAQSILELRKNEVT